MGLTITVGILPRIPVRSLPDTKRLTVTTHLGSNGETTQTQVSFADPSESDANKDFTRWFEAVASLMKENGLPPHVEPIVTQPYEAQGYGYSGLHALCEIAGLDSFGRPIPRTPLLTGSGETPTGDRLFRQALAAISEQKKPSLIERLWRKDTKPVLPRYAHLSLHGDSAGFFVPVDFPVPLFPNVMADETAHLWPLGSTQRLLAEIEDLAEALEIPDDLDEQDNILWKAMKKPVTNKALWLAQPIAAYTAIILRKACRASLASGAAIVFN